MGFHFVRCWQKSETLDLQVHWFAGLDEQVTTIWPGQPRAGHDFHFEIVEPHVGLAIPKVAFESDFLSTLTLSEGPRPHLDHGS